jgi:hypothetical protein
MSLAHGRHSPLPSSSGWRCDHVDALSSTSISDHASWVRLRLLISRLDVIHYPKIHGDKNDGGNHDDKHNQRHGGTDPLAPLGASIVRCRERWLGTSAPHSQVSVVEKFVTPVQYPGPQLGRNTTSRQPVKCECTTCPAHRHTVYVENE